MLDWSADNAALGYDPRLEQPHGNWIGGTWRPAHGGRSYESAPAGGGPGVRWPRSGAEDLEQALAATREGGAAWRAWTRAERRELLEDALAEDLFLGDPGGELAAQLGALASEVEPWIRAARRAGVAALGERRRRAPRLPAELPTEPGTALVRVHGAALFEGLVVRLWPMLLEGWSVILVADGALPGIARELCLALDHADLPPGALALLFDDGASVLRAGLSGPGVDFALVLDHADRGAEVLELAGRERGLGPASTGGGTRPRRGQGGRRGPLPVRFEALSGSCAVVRGTDDPARAARRIARAALGRSEALSGQAAGQAGWVVVHRRLFSAFSAALLVELDALGEDPLGPLAPIDPEAPRHVERLRRLGLDEGATLLRGDSGTWFDGAPGRAGGGRGSQRRAREGRLEPLVFTNVEPRMRLARARRPAPVLRLLRADDDGAALRCADEFDLAP